MTIRGYLDQAIREGRTIEIEYTKYNGEYSTRKVSDLSYSDELGSDYIAGYCHLRKENRTFKISRIRRIVGQSFMPASNVTTSEKSAYGGKSSYSNKSSNETKPQIPPTKPSTRSSSKVSSSTPSYGGSSTSYNSKSTSSQSRSSTPQKRNEGCYIATMAYGDYDHPQVLILRQFRDEELLTTVGGRLFVRIYYWLSPKLVRGLTGHDLINRQIRFLLDSFIKRL